jgi:dihydroorotase-like cyclic amidohydrolase
MNYLLIKNGLIVTGNKVFKADLLIGNDTIIDIATTIQRPDPTTPVIDAAGRFILPGSIDFCHHELTLSGVDVHDRDKLIAIEVMSGTTTLFETIEPVSVVDIEKSIGNALRLGQHNLPDFAFHFSPSRYQFINGRDLVDGYVVYGMSSIYISTGFDCTRQDGWFKKLYAHAERFNLTVIIALPDDKDVEWNHDDDTAENNHLNTMVYLDKVLQRVRNASFPVLLSRLRYKEEVALFNSYLIKNKNLNAEIEMPCSLGDQQAYNAVNESADVYNESLHLISHATFCRLAGLDNYLVMRPSLKVMIGNTSESPVFNRPDKFFGLKYYSSMFYTFTVITGKLAITDFVNCMCTKPAMLMGLYPQKGVVRVGSDADVVIWNPDAERNLYCNFVSETSPKELKLQGRAEFVFCKGKMVYDGETFFKDNLTGKYLYRHPEE